MSKFKVGDRVILVSNKDGADENGNYCSAIANSVDIGVETVVTGVDRTGWHIETERWCVCQPASCFQLVNGNNDKNIMSSIKEKFIAALLPEPEKSFRKAGITNGDGLLTEDGEKIFLTWLLNQNKTKFNEEVVQPLIKEEEEA